MLLFMALGSRLMDNMIALLCLGQSPVMNITPCMLLEVLRTVTLPRGWHWFIAEEVLPRLLLLCLEPAVQLCPDVRSINIHVRASGNQEVTIAAL